MKPGFLTYYAIGDAYGVPFEFKNELVNSFENDGQDYYINPERKNRPGRWSDDTDMTMVLARIITNYPNFKNWSTDMFAQHFYYNYQTTPIPGYSKRMIKALSKYSVTNWFQLMDRDVPSSGAAMRSSVMGLMNVSEDKLLELNRKQIEVTHTNHDAMLSAQMVTFSTYYIRTSTTLEDAKERLMKKFHLNEDFFAWEGSVGNIGMDVLKASWATLESTSNMQSCLIKAVSWGGDVDTVAAIALSWAYLAGYEDNLNDTLHTRLYQRDKIIKSSHYLENGFRVLPQYIDRLETGPLEMAGDWPGFFIRGDDVMRIVTSMKNVIQTTENEELENFYSNYLKEWVDQFEKCLVR